MTDDPTWYCQDCGVISERPHHPGCKYATTDPPDQPDSDALRFMSDGVVADLADGTTVRLRLHNANRGQTAQPLIANRVDPHNDVAQYGSDADDSHVEVWFEREK